MFSSHAPGDMQTTSHTPGAMQTTGYLSCPPSPCTPSTMSSVSPNFVPSSPSSAVTGTNSHNMSGESAVASCPSSPTHYSSTNQLTPLASAVTSSMLTMAMMTSSSGVSTEMSSSMTLTSAISPPNSPPLLTALEGPASGMSPATPLLEKEDILPLACNMTLLNTDSGEILYCCFVKYLSFLAALGEMHWPKNRCKSLKIRLQLYVFMF